jgi:hypothetical protein
LLTHWLTPPNGRKSGSKGSLKGGSVTSHLFLCPRSAHLALAYWTVNAQRTSGNPAQKFAKNLPKICQKKAAHPSQVRGF